VHRPASAEWLVIAVWVESQSPDELPVVGDDADVGASDQQSDFAVLVGDADRDVAELAEVAESDLAGGVNLVVADAVVDGWGLLCGLGLDE
jgi:hypothetical protein